jgi:hypothetical protein
MMREVRVDETQARTDTGLAHGLQITSSCVPRKTQKDKTYLDTRNKIHVVAPRFIGALKPYETGILRHFYQRFNALE